MASQTNRPQSNDFHAFIEICAACSTVGGVGSGGVVGGGLMRSTGLAPSHSHRTALLQASLRMLCSFRRVPLASGWHSWGHATLVALVVAAGAVLHGPTAAGAVGAAAAERGEEAVQDLAVEAADGESSQQWADVDADDALVPVVGGSAPRRAAPGTGP